MTDQSDSMKGNKKVIRYKRYLSNYVNEYEIRVFNEHDIEHKDPIGFIKWIDEEWQEYEV